MFWLMLYDYVMLHSRCSHINQTYATLHAMHKMGRDMKCDTVVAAHVVFATRRLLPHGTALPRYAPLSSTSYTNHRHNCKSHKTVTIVRSHIITTDRL